MLTARSGRSTTRRRAHNLWLGGWLASSAERNVESRRLLFSVHNKATARAGVGRGAPQVSVVDTVNVVVGESCSA